MDGSAGQKVVAERAVRLLMCLAKVLMLWVCHRLSDEEVTGQWYPLPQWPSGKASALVSGRQGDRSPLSLVESNW